MLLLLAVAGLATFGLQKPQKANATINRQINFQGKVVLNSNSTNISNGTYNMEFKIYSGGNGVVGGGDETLLWTEDRLVGGTGGVTLTDGVFQVSLGSVTSLPGSVDFNNSTIWLSMQLGNTSSCTITTSFQSDCSGDGEMSPMVRFTAAPYAFNSDTLDGIDSAAFGQLSASNTWTGTQTLQPTTNITSAIVRQTSVGSPTADIFNIQTANNTNILQVTGPAANEAAVTLASVGATRDLTLDSASGTLKLGSNTTTLQKSGTAFTFDLNNSSNSTITITNAGSGTGSLSVEGNITAGGTIFASTFDRSTAGQLSIGTGGASNATSIVVGSSSVTGITFTTDNNAANDIQFTGGTTFSSDAVINGHLALGNAASNSAAATLRLQETFDTNDNCGLGCYGIQSFPTITNPTAPSRGVGVVTKVSTGAASFALTEADGILLQDPGVGAGSSITTNIGLRIDNMTAGSSDYAISLGGADTADILFETDRTHILKVQDQDTSATAGSALQITGANGNTSGAGGDISLTSGNGGGTGTTNAGTITINNGTKSGAGTATINIGTSNTTALNLGSSATTSTLLGVVSINASGSSATGIGSGSYSGTLTVGNSSSTTNISGGSSSTISFTNFGVSTAGVITLQGGQTKDITTANASTANGINIQPGSTTASNSTGATLTLSGGDVSTVTCNATQCVGGNVVIQGGSPAAGTGTRKGGNVLIDGGSGTGGVATHGALLIGTGTTSSISLGNPLSGHSISIYGDTNSTIEYSNFLVTSGSATLGSSSNVAGSIALFDGSGNTSATLNTSGIGTSYTLTLPTTGATGSQCLQSTSGSTSTATTLQFSACGGGGGDNITVNGSAATDANFIDTTATGSLAGTSWTLNTAPTPDTIALTISVASGSIAGVVDTNAQTFAGSKTFVGTDTLVHGTSDSDTSFQVQDTFNNDVFHVDTNNGFFGSGDCSGSPVTSGSTNFACLQGFNVGGQLYLGSGADAWVSLVQTSATDNAVLSSKYGVTITTPSSTQEALTVSNGTSSGNILVLQANTTPVATFSSTTLTLGAGYNLTTTSGTGTITLNSTFNNASGNAIGITPSFTGGATNGLTYNAINLAAFSPTNASGTDTVNGLNIGNITDPGATITSSAFRVGTGWDTIFGGTTAGTNLFGFTNFTVTTGGAITAVGLNAGSGQIQGTGGLSVSGNATLAATAGNTVGIGNSTGAITVTGSSGSTFVINGTTIDATEFNRLNGTSAALVDQDDFISSDGAGATSSGSGLESGTGGIGLLQGCTNGQVLKWNDTSSIWECNADSTSGTSQFVVKGSNENVPSGTTLQDDNSLIFPVAAGETWVFDFVLRVTNVNSATPDWKSAVKGAAGWTCNWTLSGVEPAGAAFPQVNGTDCDNAPTALANATIVADGNVPFQVNMRGTITTTSSGSVTLQWAANTSGSLTVMGGSYVIAQKVGGSDLAEIYYTNEDDVGPGDVVTADPALPAGVKKSVGPYDRRLIGVISTKPGLLLGDETSNYQGRAVQLALSGRVPVKVSTENGPIVPGDLLTSSSTPGVAMKATKAGTVIGQALTNYEGNGVGEIQMFIKNTVSNGNANASAGASGEEILNALMSGNATSADTSNLSEVNTDRVIAGLEIVTPKITADMVLTNTIHAAQGQNIAIDIDEGGKLLLRGPGGLQTIVFDSTGNLSLSGALTVAGALSVNGQAQFKGETIFKGNIYFSNNSGGYAVINKDKQEVEVVFQKPYKDTDTLPIIIVNVKDGQFVNFAYKDVTKNGFKIVLSQPAAQDTEFAWTAFNITDPKTTESPTN